MNRLWTILLLVPLMPLGLLTCCQHKLIYLPRPYTDPLPSHFLSSGGEKIQYKTGQGTQTSWLRKPSGKPASTLWIVCGGNGTLALELEEVVMSHVQANDAVLFFEYPGYGESDGSSTPGRLRESLAKAVPLAAQSCGIPMDQLPERTVVFGHSLGAAVALEAAEAYSLQRAILIAPFTSTMEMASIVTGMPVGWLVTHRFNNREKIASLAKRGGKAWILHGEDDEVIPVQMGETLAKIGGEAVTFKAIPGNRHNDIFRKSEHALANAFSAARPKDPVP